MSDLLPTDPRCTCGYAERKPIDGAFSHYSFCPAATGAPKFRAIQIHTRVGPQWHLQRRRWRGWKTVDWFSTEEGAQAALNVMAAPKIIYPEAQT